MNGIFRCSVVALALAGMSFAQIGERRVNQQRRIAQGVRSGELKPRETARLERQEARINHQIRHDRAINNGHLTGAERRQINRRQNRESARIYRAKHN